MSAESDSGGSSHGADSRAPAEVFVDCEYGDLKEVVVGLPFALVPDIREAMWVAEASKLLPPEELEKALQLSGKDTIETGKYDAMEEENRALIAILERHGVRVWRPELLTREQVAANFGESFLRIAGFSQQYVRDPLLVIGNNLIENAMGSLIRRSDILGLRRLFAERLAGSGARWVAMPGLDYSQTICEGRYDKHLAAVIEGGDVILLGQRVLVGNSANRAAGSSELGYRWLRSYLEPQGYAVERVPLPDDILHLDVVLSVPRPGVVILCPEVFIEGVPACFDGWQRIEVTRDAARHLATNGLPIDQDHYIIGTNDAFDGTDVQRPLEALGITVYPIPFGRHTEDGGSIRCSTHPLVRRLADARDSG